MSISITINDINNLTDMDRDVLRLVSNRAIATSLQQHVRGVTLLHDTGEGVVRVSDEHIESLVAEGVAEVFKQPTPVEPPEVFSPHTIVSTVEAAAPAAPASAELDSKGLPWDKRIHSSSRAKVADGSWRKFRGVDDALVASVEAELRGVQAAPQAPAGWPFGAGAPEQQDAAAAAQDIAPPAPPAPVATTPTPPVPPVPQVPSALPAVPVPATDAPPATFAEMMQRITPLIVSGELTQVRVNEVCAQLQLPHLAAIGARPDLIPAAFAALMQKEV